LHALNNGRHRLTPAKTKPRLTRQMVVSLLELLLLLLLLRL